VRAGSTSGGFTLTEVLAVTIIVVILIGISVPSFNSMLESANQTRASTLLRLGASAAQDAAIRADDARDTAAFFLFEPGGRITIVVGKEVGEYRPPSGVDGGDGEPRSIFVADPTLESIEMPARMLVRGLAPANSIEQGIDGDVTGYAWYADSRYEHDQLNWVLPETGLLDPESLDDDEGYKRQSFMLRFEGGTGRAATDVKRQALLFDPRPEVEFRTRSPWTNGADPYVRPDLNPNHRMLVRKALGDPNLDADDRELLIGDRSPDTVLARQVSMVALYDARELASAVGSADSPPADFGGVDARTGSLYDGFDLTVPAIDRSVSDAVNARIRSVAELFTLERYSGRLARVVGEDPEEN